MMSDETRPCKKRAANRKLCKDNLDLDTEEDVSEHKKGRTFKKASISRELVKVRCHQTVENAAETVGECEGTQGYYIPIDIVANILARVSVPPLLRFKCVSKTWYNLITSKSFIPIHLQNKHMMNRTNKSFYQPFGTNLSGGIHIFFCVTPLDFDHIDKSYELYTLDLSSASTIGHQQNTLTINGVQRLPYPDKCPTIPIGSCNGIVCLRDIEGSGLALFNPTNRSYFELPRQGAVQAEYAFYGFGYDVASDDYKLVMTRSLCSRLSIFSWRNKQWRTWSKFQESTYYLTSYSHEPHVYIGIFCNNMLHWMAVREDPPKNARLVITRFDLCNDKFDKITFPVPIRGLAEVVLAELHGMLVLIKSSTFSRGTNLWIMKEYGVNESWSKLCSIRNDDGFLWPITLSKSGNELLINQRIDNGRRFKFSWVNIATGKKRTSFIDYTLPSSAEYHLSQPYLPSFVNLNVDNPEKPRS